MNVNLQNKNSFSFNFKIIDNDNNYKKLKNIFLRKQDIYLIKLLEKRAKYNKDTKKYKEFKTNIPYNNMQNNIKSFITYKPSTINQLLDYKNIRIIKKKKDKSQDNNNYILDNINTKFQNEDLITSRIYNSDSSRNNKTMLNVKIENNNIQEDNNIVLKTIFESQNKKINDLKREFNKTALNNIINQKGNNMISYTIIEKLKNRDSNYTKYNNKKHKIKHQYLLKDNMHYEKSVKNKHNLNPIYKKIFQNVNENQSNSIFYNNDIKNELNNSIKKSSKFHKIFRLLKKDQKYNDIRHKINICDYKLEKGRNNNNTIQINHSLNKPNNIPTLDSFLNELPYINKCHNFE